MRCLNIVFYLLCFLILFESTSLASIGGVFTAPAAITILPIYLIIGFVNIYKINLLEKKILLAFFVFILYSIIMSFVFFSEYDNYFVVDRGTRFLLLATPPLMIFVICLRQNISTLESGITIITFISIVSLLMNVFIPDTLNFRSFIHYTDALSPNRLRGFTLEASTFGFQIITVLLLFSIVKKINLNLYIPILLFISILSTSKGTLLVLCISVLVCVMFCMKSKLKYPMMICVSIFSIMLYDSFLENSFELDLERYTTIATRGTMYFTAINILIDYPLGSGYFGFLPAIYENGLQGINTFQFFYPGHLNLQEVLVFFSEGATKGISTKTFFFDWMIFAGLPFIVCFIYFNFHLFKVFKAYSAYPEMICLVFISTSLTTFVPIEGHYIAPFAYALLVLRSRTIIKNSQISNP